MKRSVVIALLGNAVPPALALLAAPILALELGVSGRGEVAAATAPLLLCMAALTLGVPEALTYFRAKNTLGSRLTVTSYLLLLVVIGAGGVGVVALLSQTLAAGDVILAQILILATLGLVPALLVAGLRGLAMGAAQWWLVTIERCCSAATRLAAIVILAITGNLTPLTASIAIAIGTFAGGFVYIFQRSKVKTGATVRRRHFFSYGARVWVGAIAGILLLRLSQVVMTPLAGVHELGIFAVAVNLSEAVLVFNAAVRDVVFATASGRIDPNVVARAARTSTAITAVAGIGVAASSPWLVPILFGPDFEAAITVTLILLIGIVLGNAGSVAGAGLSGFGRPGLRSTAIVIGLIVNIGSLFLLVPTLGAIGAAIASLLGSVSSGWVSLWAFRRVSNLPLSSLIRVNKNDLRAVADLIRRR